MFPQSLQVYSTLTIQLRNDYLPRNLLLYPRFEFKLDLDPLGSRLNQRRSRGLYYASPARLTGVLVSALADTERAYLVAVENGVLCGLADSDTAQRLAVSQLKVSVIRETSLRSSLSTFSALCDMFNIRRTVVILRCLGEVRELGTHIEISNETQLREVSHPLSNRKTISLRRRGSLV
ncbi:hypothetical protein MSAN_00677500 [Mycena sanguinolenta]|uniref:Uncharacterized protein n=1 Tax=Mycena sanguinolenta TaxID=230812 RepID=A0A8H6Z432_9AGAR|nr:hypothetical protein MSAN_00677500 [Mycena sanguinolenta]